jgi:hypothetical protein
MRDWTADIWLDYAKRMDFRNKDGGPLITWTDPESAFEHWKRSSAGRPCDYSGMTYELLSQGSGIQWVRFDRSFHRTCRAEAELTALQRGVPEGLRTPLH